MVRPTSDRSWLLPRLGAGAGAALCVLLLGVEAAGAAALARPGPARPGEIAAAAARAPWVARRGRKTKGAKPAPAAAVEPVKVRSAGTTKATLQVGKGKGNPVFVAEPGKPLELTFSGPGQLTLELHQVVPAKAKRPGELTVELRIDGKAVKAQQLPSTPLKRARLSGGPAGVVAKPKRWSDAVSAGAHTASLTVPEGAHAVAVLIELRPAGSKSAAPVILEPAAKNPDLMAAALELLDDDEPALAPSPPPGPPPPSGGSPAEVVTATPVAEPAVAAPAVKEETVAERVQRQVAKGELRAGLLDTYAPVEVVDQETGERQDFFRVEAERTFSLLVAGPGVVTVRLHRMIDPVRTPPDGEASYAVAILENDVLLQRLAGVTRPSATRRLAAPLATELLSEPKEYQLKVGPKKSTLALLIAEAPEGMVIRYDFAAEEQSLAALALDLGDEDEDLIGVSVSVMPTVVMEIDLTEKAASVVEVRQELVALFVQAGAHLPQTGGQPGLAAALELDLMLPLWGRRLGLGVRAGVQQHQLSVRFADPDGAAVRASSSALAVPVLGELILRLPLGSPGGVDLALVLQGGAGVAYLRATRRALGATDSGAQLGLAAHGGGAFELRLGPGWLALAGDYLWGPPADLGASLADYSVQGASVALRYRLGF